MAFDLVSAHTRKDIVRDIVKFVSDLAAGIAKQDDREINVVCDLPDPNAVNDTRTDASNGLVIVRLPEYLVLWANDSFPADDMLNFADTDPRDELVDGGTPEILAVFKIEESEDHSVDELLTALIGPDFRFYGEAILRARCIVYSPYVRRNTALC